jgi:hypothetical protein
MRTPSPPPLREAPDDRVPAAPRTRHALPPASEAPARTTGETDAVIVAPRPDPAVQHHPMHEERAVAPAAAAVGTVARDVQPKPEPGPERSEPVRVLTPVARRPADVVADRVPHVKAVAPPSADTSVTGRDFMAAEPLAGRETRGRQGKSLSRVTPAVESIRDHRDTPANSSHADDRAPSVSRVEIGSIEVRVTAPQPAPQIVKRRAAGTLVRSTAVYGLRQS